MQVCAILQGFSGCSDKTAINAFLEALEFLATLLENKLFALQRVSLGGLWVI